MPGHAGHQGPGAGLPRAQPDLGQRREHLDLIFGRTTPLLPLLGSISTQQGVSWLS